MRVTHANPRNLFRLISSSPHANLPTRIAGRLSEDKNTSLFNEMTIAEFVELATVLLPSKSDVISTKAWVTTMTPFGQMIVLALAALGLAATSCRKVDTQSATPLAIKPSELFSTNAQKRCLDRASQLSISATQQAALCGKASSSAPVDCFKKKTSTGSNVDATISACQGAK